MAALSKVAELKSCEIEFIFDSSGWSSKQVLLTPKML